MYRAQGLFHQIKNVTEEWLENLLPLLRVAIPPILLNILLVQTVDTVYIPYVGIGISGLMMRCIVIGTHIISMMLGFDSTGTRGVLYELASCFLATEITLFIYYMQHQFVSAVSLLAILMAGAVFVLTCGKKQLNDLYQIRYIPQTLMDDIIVSANNKRKPFALVSVAIRRYLTIATAVLFFFPAMSVIAVYGFDGNQQYGQEHAVIDATQNNQMLLNMETLQLLDENVWHQLADQEKVNALQIIADIETHYLGIEPVVVVNGHLGYRTAGTYDPAERTAKIDLEKHEGDSPIEYVNTILHECRHAYQHDCIDSLDWNNPDIQNGIYYAPVRAWRYEHANYISLVEDREAYYSQSIELDARQYAQDGVYVYQQYIDFGNLPAR